MTEHMSTEDGKSRGRRNRSASAPRTASREAQKHLTSPPHPLIPEGANVLLEPVKRENKIGRFHLQSDVAADGGFSRGKVLAIGPWVEGITLKVGETVVMKSYTGSPVQHDGKEYLIVPAKELLYAEE